MKKALLTTALIAALGTSATAQGIQPVATTPDLDVTVGTIGNVSPAIIVAASAALIVGITLIGEGEDNAPSGTN